MQAKVEQGNEGGSYAVGNETNEANEGPHNMRGVEL